MRRMTVGKFELALSDECEWSSHVDNQLMVDLLNSLADIRLSQIEAADGEPAALIFQDAVALLEPEQVNDPQIPSFTEYGVVY
jgi:hypothetical protein